MKLAYLANIRFPTEKAHGLQIVQMLGAFSKLHGEGVNEVELIVPRRFNTVVADPFLYYGVGKSFKIVRLPCLDLIPLNSGRLSFVLQTLTFLISARIYLSLWPRDILYSRDLSAGLFFRNLVLELHSLPKQLKNFQKKILKQSRKIVVLTSFLKKSLVTAGIDPAQILVSPDAVDLERFSLEISKEEARQKLNLLQQAKIIGYVGMLKTLGMEKGIDVAISALAYLPHDYLLLLVGGNDSDIKAYREFAGARHLKNQVLFVGKVPHNEVPLYLKASDVLVAPFPANEHFSYFMSPMKVFEYMASGRPIIASDLPSIREVLNDDNSFLINPSDPKAFAFAVRDATENCTFSGKIAGVARLDAERYTWDARVLKILKFILNHEG